MITGGFGTWTLCRGTVQKYKITMTRLVDQLTTVIAVVIDAA